MEIWITRAWPWLRDVFCHSSSSFVYFLDSDLLFSVWKMSEKTFVCFIFSFKPKDAQFAVTYDEDEQEIFTFKQETWKWSKQQRYVLVDAIKALFCPLICAQIRRWWTVIAYKRKCQKNTVVIAALTEDTSHTHRRQKASLGAAAVWTLLTTTHLLFYLWCSPQQRTLPPSPATHTQTYPHTTVDCFCRVRFFSFLLLLLVSPHLICSSSTQEC